MEEMFIENGEKRLKAFVYCSSNRRAVIMCHGFSGNSSGIFGPELAQSLSNSNLVCRFDFSGQGESSGRFYDTSISTELADLDIIVRYVRETYTPQNIILLGHSFGAAIAILYATQHSVDGVISLSGEGDLKKALDIEFSAKQQKELEEKGEVRFQNWSKEGDEDLLGRQFYDDMKRYNTLRAAREISGPVLYIHGKSDEEIPYSASEEMYRQGGKNRELAIVEDANHIYNWFSENKKITEMTKVINSWLEKNFKK